MSISVVVITWDGAQWVTEQARSIVAQTFPRDEVALADDASTDATVALALDALAPLNRPVEVLRSEARLGVTQNIERAIRATTGDIVVLADQDDMWLPHKLATVAHWAEADSTGGFASDGWIVDADTRRTGERLWARAGFSDRERTHWRHDPLRVLLRQPVLTGATMALRRDALDLVLPLPEVGWHDYAMSLLLAATTGITLVDDPLVEYRLHGTNTAGLRAPARRDRVLSPAAQRANQAEQVRFFDALGDRLAAHGHTDAARRIAAKADVLRHRAALPAARVRRLPGVARLTLTGGYHRYGQGWASAARDLFWP